MKGLSFFEKNWVVVGGSGSGCEWVLEMDTSKKTHTVIIYCPRFKNRVS